MGGSHLTDEPSQKGAEMTKSDLIRYLKKNDACEPAISWLNRQETFGPELIEKCPDVGWLEWLGCRVNPAEYDAKRKPLRDEYEAKMDLLWDEYQAKAGPLRDEYEAKMGHLWDEYDAKKKPLRDEYEAKRKPLRDEYYAKVKPLQDEYKTKMDHLRDEYDAKEKPLQDEYKTKMDHLQDEYKTKMDHLRDEYDAKMRVALLDILTWEMIGKAVAASDING